MISMNLEGIKILDMTRLLPGPYATMLLGDLGAEIIKIEGPGSGDYARDMEPKVNGTGAPFLMLNRNKKAIELDLKKEKGKEVFFELVEEADVVFEQFRPGVVENLGVDYETVKEINPDVIYCSLSSYGQTGPYSDRGGHDLNYMAESGLIDMTRSKDGKPAIPGFPISVMVAGQFSAFSIVSALLDRELHGSSGEYIDLSIFESLVSLSSPIAWQPLLFDEVPRGGETDLTGALPFYDIYRTKDGRYLALAAYEPEFWENFCELIGREELKDRQFAEGDEREEVREIIKEEFRKKTLEGWMHSLKDEEVMISPVKNLKEVFEDEHLEERGLIGKVDLDGRKIEQVGFPAKSDKDVNEFRHGPPGRGEHTREVLKGLGYTDEEIDGLEEKKII